MVIELLMPKNIFLMKLMKIKKRKREGGEEEMYTIKQ